MMRERLLTSIGPFAVSTGALKDALMIDARRRSRIAFAPPTDPLRPQLAAGSFIDCLEDWSTENAS